MFVKPPGPRYKVATEGDELIIRIPARRNIFILLFLSVWLCAWVIGEIMVPKMLWSNPKRDVEAVLFLIVWLSGWTVGGAFAVYVWLWNLNGCEVITLSRDALGIKREIFGHGRARQYDLSEVSHLCVPPRVYNFFDPRSAFAFWGIAGGAIAFDYGFKTFRFGVGIDEAEGRAILQAILDRAPRLADPKST